MKIIKVRDHYINIDTLCEFYVDKTEMGNEYTHIITTNSKIILSGDITSELSKTLASFNEAGIKILR